MKGDAQHGRRVPELLAPAGGPAAGYAALHYGADAVYLGLAKFSARADAENFTLDQVSEITAYAHALVPRRRVYAALNTLVLQRELDELIDQLGALAEIGVDAVIVQDLGVGYIARRHFPELRLHASTQLAIHNRQGMEAARELGFARATLARELTLAEIAEAAAATGIETEVFIHGALCYAYSGLCLFSSQTLGRSGNRGRCAYLCRDRFAPAGADPGAAPAAPERAGFLFSMKDLALADALPALRRAGVAALKIEGRKKSPLYVAAAVNYYRQLLDESIAEGEARALAADLQTIFSRPWTSLYVSSRENRRVVDRDWVGHRGAPIGKLEAIVRSRSGERRLRFRAGRDIELHDGLQVDVPGLPRPYGFAVDWFRIARLTNRGLPGAGNSASACRYRAPAGSLLEVALPADAPEMPRGAVVYCASSQAIKRRYHVARPKPGQFRVRPPASFHIEVAPDSLRVTASLPRRLPPAVEATQRLTGDFQAASDPDRMLATFKEVFGKLGATPFSAGSLAVANPAARFVPISMLNPLRRRLLEVLEQRWQDAIRERLAPVKREWAVPGGQDLARAQGQLPPGDSAGRSAFRWSVKTDRAAVLDAFDAGDWSDVDEVIVELGAESIAHLPASLQRLSARAGREHLRLALPPIVRAWEGRALEEGIAGLIRDGWLKWQIANISGWAWLKSLARSPACALNIAADWPIYVVNRAAARQVMALGADSLTLSPEDGVENMRSLLAEWGARAVVAAYQDTPLFVSETCVGAEANIDRDGIDRTQVDMLELKSSFGDRVTALNRRGRTVVINSRPFCLASRFKELRQAGAARLRADFLFRAYAPEQARDIWRRLRAGGPLAGTQAANFDRGLE